MPPTITVTPAEGRWVARAGGAILAESDRAQELREGSRPPVIYFPREDVAIELFDRSPTRTTCPWKGEASYFTFTGTEGRIPDAAWSYESPRAEVAAIAGHLAFYTNKVAVERS